MNSVNKTLYIPLYGKAYVSSRGILLSDKKAEEIWKAEGFPLKGKSKSKWLAYYMGMRSAVFDRWVREQMDCMPGAVVLHLGCGMDSRALRVENTAHLWFDVDFPEVIAERKRYFAENEKYRMIGADVCDIRWLEAIPRGGSAIVIMEGISMYLQKDALRVLLQSLKDRFEAVALLMDCYTEMAAKASKVRNPINDVGVTEVYGMDDPESVAVLPFVREHAMTPENMITQLPRGEQGIFRKLYAGRIARKMYRLYEYRWIGSLQ